MSLAEKLDAIREGARKRVAPERRALMSRAVQELRDSGLLERVLGPGDRLPEFALANARGATVRSADLLAERAVVLSVFRGSW